MRTVRWLAWSVGILFLVGTALQLVDVLNLYVTPPQGSPATMVEARLASYDYRVAIWPVFFLTNVSVAVAFVALTGLGFALATGLASGDQRRIAIATSFGVAGILGAAGQLISSVRRKPRSTSSTTTAASGTRRSSARSGPR